MLLSSVADTLRIWSFSAQPSAGESPLTLRVSSEPYLPREKPSTLSWNHTNQVIAVAGAESPSISLVQVSNGQLLSSLPFSEAEACTGGIHAIAFSGNSRYLAAGSARSVYLYDLKRRNLRATSPEQRGDVSCVAIAPEGEVVIGDQAGVVCVWDLRQSSSQTTTDLFLPPPSSSSSATDSFGSGSSVFAVGPAVTSLRLSLIGPPRIATGYADGTLAVWDFTTKALLRRQAVHTGPLAGLAYSPKNSRLVATAGADGRLALVDTGSKGSTDPSAAVDVGERLSCVSFNEDAIHCAVGTHSGHILIYDWRNVRKPLCRVEASPHVPVADLSFQLPSLKSSAPSTPSRSVRSVQGSDVNSSPGSNAARAAPAASSTSPLRPTRTVPPSPNPLKLSLAGNSVAASGTVEGAHPGVNTQLATLPGTPSVSAQPPSLTSSIDSTVSSLSTATATSAAPVTASANSSAKPTGENTFRQSHINPGPSSVRGPITAPPAPVSTAQRAVPTLAAEEVRTSSTVGAGFGSRAAAPPASSPKAPLVGSGADAAQLGIGEAKGLLTEASSRASSVEIPSRGREDTQGKQEGSFVVGAQRQRPPDDPALTVTTVDISGASRLAAGTRPSATRPPSTPGSVAHAGATNGEKGAALGPGGTEEASGEFSMLKRALALQPVTSQELQESLQILRYDMHKEVQGIVKEQIRQFALAKEDMTAVVMELKEQLSELLAANRELRAENERLRRIY